MRYSIMELLSRSWDRQWPAANTKSQVYTPCRGRVMAGLVYRHRCPEQTCDEATSTYTTSRDEDTIDYFISFMQNSTLPRIVQPEPRS
ncbi:hypothetical protein C8Q79DRAFT_981164 [Trametes meyenii]|nr:hypothetical protein C8Q79DRAFT_981164 [Trametes meyenii]